jgi:hypothetical protein
VLTRLRRGSRRRFGGLEYQLVVYRIRASQVVKKGMNILIDVVGLRISSNDGLIIPDKKARFGSWITALTRYAISSLR